MAALPPAEPPTLARLRETSSCGQLHSQPRLGAAAINQWQAGPKALLSPLYRTLGGEGPVVSLSLRALSAMIWEGQAPLSRSQGHGRASQLPRLFLLSLPQAHQ